MAATTAVRRSDAGLLGNPAVAWVVRNRSRIAVRIVLWLMLLYFLFPILWALSASLKTRQELYTGTPSLIPLHPTIENYTFAIKKLTGFGLMYRNSVIVTLGSVALLTVCATPAGYGFARVRFKG